MGHNVFSEKPLNQGKLLEILARAGCKPRFLCSVPADPSNLPLRETYIGTHPHTEREAALKVIEGTRFEREYAAFSGICRPDGSPLRSFAQHLKPIIVSEGNNFYTIIGSGIVSGESLSTISKPRDMDLFRRLFLDEILFELEIVNASKVSLGDLKSDHVLFDENQPSLRLIDMGGALIHGRILEHYTPAFTHHIFDPRKECSPVTSFHDAYAASLILENFAQRMGVSGEPGYTGAVQLRHEWSPLRVSPENPFEELMYRLREPERIAARNVISRRSMIKKLLAASVLTSSSGTVIAEEILRHVSKERYGILKGSLPEPEELARSLAERIRLLDVSGRGPEGTSFFYNAAEKSVPNHSIGSKTVSAPSISVAGSETAELLWSASRFVPELALTANRITSDIIAGIKNHQFTYASAYLVDTGHLRAAFNQTNRVEYLQQILPVVAKLTEWLNNDPRLLSGAGDRKMDARFASIPFIRESGREQYGLVFPSDVRCIDSFIDLLEALPVLYKNGLISEHGRIDLSASANESIDKILSTTNVLVNNDLVSSSAALYVYPAVPNKRFVSHAQGIYALTLARLGTLRDNSALKKKSEDLANVIVRANPLRYDLRDDTSHISNAGLAPAYRALRLLGSPHAEKIFPRLFSALVDVKVGLFGKTIIKEKGLLANTCYGPNDCGVGPVYDRDTFCGLIVHSPKRH